jgi:membrane-associated progesterone receptor component
MTLRLTPEQLAKHDGRDAAAPLYIAIRGKVYDVTAGRSFYGPGGPYSAFGGRECARALAFMKITPDFIGTPDLADASEQQLKTLADWEAKLSAKYPVVGELTS